MFITATNQGSEMKLLFALLILGTSTASFADTYVRGHTTKNGTYVEPHYRSSPNSSTYDNYSTKGNSNPYTGKEGNVEAQPSYQYSPPKTEYRNPYDINN